MSNGLKSSERSVPFEVKDPTLDQIYLIRLNLSQPSSIRERPVGQIWLKSGEMFFYANLLPKLGHPQGHIWVKLTSALTSALGQT